MSDSPPRLATRILGGALPRDFRDEALDDLADLFRLRVARDGVPAANRWYWRQIPGFILRLQLATALGGSLAAHPTHRQLTHPPGEKMTSILSDLRQGVRTALRNPAFTAIAVLTLALGIGANAAIFSVVRSVLLRPLPFPEADRIVSLSETRADRNMFEIGFTYANFWDVVEQNRTLSAVGAIRWRPMNLTGDAEPVNLSVASTTVGFFRALGVSPFLGRLLVDGEDATGSDTRKAILSHALWRSRFGEDSTILSRSITLDGESYQVIGVLPPGTPWLDAAELFLPLPKPANPNRDSWELPVVARLKPGVTLAAARSDLDGLAKRLSEQFPEAKGMGINAQTTEEWVASESLRRAVWVLFGAVGFLLVIACVNLANMLLARATGRARERAMRAALGASRGRMAQLALSESAVLGLLGGALGLAIAFGMVKVLLAISPADIPRLALTRIDGAVLALTFTVAFLTSLVTGLVPALRTPYYDLVSAIRDGERSVAGGRRSGRARSALVAVEVALSLILLVGAGLLIRSFDRVLSVNRGFVSEGRVLVDVAFGGSRTEAEGERKARVLQDFLGRVRSLPQVSSAAAVHIRPLGGSGTGMGFGAADRPEATGAVVPWAGWRLVTDGYFKTMGLPLIAGRDFNAQDRLGQPWKVIISQRVAETLWPGQSAVGRTMVLWKGQGQSMGEVIGVVGNMRDWDLTEDPTNSVYLPMNGISRNVAFVVVHTSMPPSPLTPLLRSLMKELDPNVPIANARTLDSLVGDSVASRRFTMLLLASLAMVALILTLAGVYGVLSYTVSQRRAEMGVRLALGASHQSVLRLVVLQGMQPVVVGLVVGVGGALALTRLMTGLLYGLGRVDLPSYGAVVALLAGAAALACYVPARQVLNVDVTSTLREE